MGTGLSFWMLAGEICRWSWTGFGGVGDLIGFLVLGFDELGSRIGFSLKFFEYFFVNFFLGWKVKSWD